jgi:hypothetical protein
VWRGVAWRGVGWGVRREHGQPAVRAHHRRRHPSSTRHTISNAPRAPPPPPRARGGPPGRPCSTADLALAASLPPCSRVPNWPLGTSRLRLLEPTKSCARPTIVDCRLASPWWYAECSDT